MSRAATLSLVRQCTSGISSPARHTVRTRTARVATLHVRLRPYSTQNGEKERNGEEEGKKEEEKMGNGNGEEKREAEVKESSDEAHSECLKKLKAKEDEVVDLTSRLRYLQADFLNLQRNAAREKEQTRDFAITRFAGDLLETVDVLSLALKSVPESALKAPAEGEAGDVSGSVPDAASQTASTTDSTSPSSTTTSASDSTEQTKTPSEYLRELHHGVEMTQRLLIQTLFKYGVKPFDPTGDAFDPNKHEALYQAPIPGKKPGTVIDCQKTGYTIKERTLRAAQVGVASEPPNNSS